MGGEHSAVRGAHADGASEVRFYATDRENRLPETSFARARPVALRTEIKSAAPWERSALSHGLHLVRHRNKRSEPSARALPKVVGPEELLCFRSDLSEAANGKSFLARKATEGPAYRRPCGATARSLRRKGARKNCLAARPGLSHPRNPSRQIAARQKLSVCQRLRPRDPAAD